MSTTTNYHNRLIDVSIFQGIKETGKVTVDQSLFNNGGAVCTGIQKLIQRWLVTFLTPIGETKFHPEWGTSFLEEASGFRTEIDAQISFYTCNANACAQLRDEEDTDMPYEERIDRVELDDISVGTTGFNLSVRLYSLNGESAPLILPITINPLQL